MNSEFGDWPDDELPDGFASDDADTADLSGVGEDYPPAGLEGFGPADEVQGFGSADEPALDEVSADGVGGAGAGLDYGDDLSGPDDAAEDGFGAAPAAEEGFGAALGDEQGFGAADPPPGVDPDAPAGADEWPAAVFPPTLDPSGLPTPVDGWPWADPDLLGAGSSSDAVDPADLAGNVGSVDPADLAGYAGVDGAAADLWATLLGSDDPATSTLARFWSAG